MNDNVSATIHASGEEVAPLEITLEEKELIYSQAVWQARLTLSLYIHTGIYATVMLLLLAINLLATPNVLWVVWPLLGWGLGLVIHWLTIRKLLPYYQALKENEIARQLEIRQGH